MTDYHSARNLPGLPPFVLKDATNGVALEADEKSEGQESRSTTTTKTNYHVFPNETMWPMMFPYHVPTGFSVCGVSNTIISGASNQGTSAASVPSIVSSAQNSQAYQEPEQDLAQKMENLHTRQLLDELQIRELCKDTKTGTTDARKQELGALRRKLRAVADDGTSDNELALLQLQIARLTASLGHRGSAKTAFHKALCLCVKVHGRIHIIVADLLLELGDFLQDKVGDYQGAMDKYIEALDIYQRLLGEKHIMVGNTYYRMGCTVLHQGFPDQAADFLQESLRIQTTHYLRLHVAPQRVGDTLETIGCAQIKSGKIIEALASFQDALRIRRRQPDKIPVASTLKNIFNIYRTQQEYGLAMGCFEEWLVIMGDLYSSLGKPDEAVKFYREALTMRTSLLDRDRMDALQAATRHFKDGEIALALSLYLQFLQACQDSGGGHQKECFHAFVLSGNCYYLQGKVDESKRCFYEAAEIHPGDATFCGNVGASCTIQHVLYKLIREVNNASRFGIMLERVKWMTKDVGTRTMPRRVSSSLPWRTWLSRRISSPGPNAGQISHGTH